MFKLFLKDYFAQIKGVIKYLILGLVLFQFTRLLYILFNYAEFPGIEQKSLISFLWHGLPFDISALFYLNLPLILLGLFPCRVFGKFTSIILKSLFVLGTGLGLIINVNDIIYLEFTGKRIGWDIFEMTKTVTNGWELAGSFALDYWYLVLIAIAFIVVLIRWTRKQEMLFPKFQFFPFLSALPIWALLIGLSVLGLRGGLRIRPLKPIDAGNFTEAAFVPIVLNGPFCLIQGKTKNTVEQFTFFEANEVDNITGYSRVFKDSTTFQQKNVVLIILESFNKDIIGKYNQGNGVTPVLDSLLDLGLDFTNCFANGRKSIEGIPAILSGIPAITSAPLLSSQYGDVKFPSLFNYLGNKGYNSHFYHGAEIGTMYLNSYAFANGLQHYQGMEDYPTLKKDYDGHWGVFDEPYLQYFAKEMIKSKEPFVSAIFTLTSHHPYAVPAHLSEQFPEDGTKINKTYRYTDYALGKYFETARNEPWFNNTLFIITADHTFKSNSVNKKHKTLLGKYRIPLLFYAPGDSTLKGTSDRICQQIDIIPSVLDYLNYPDTVKSFGQSVFSTSEGYAIAHLNKIYHLVMDDHFYTFTGKEYAGVYNYQTDTLLQYNLLEQNFDIPGKADSLLKATIQSFNNKLVNNNF